MHVAYELDRRRTRLRDALWRRNLASVVGALCNSERRDAAGHRRGRVLSSVDLCRRTRDPLSQWTPDEVGVDVDLRDVDTDELIAACRL